MTDIIETTTDPDIDDSDYSPSDWDDMDDDDDVDVEEEEEESLEFLRFAQKIVDNDPRIQALKDAPELSAKEHADLRLTAMEIQQDIQYAQDDFKRLNPDATEVQVEEYIAAVFERDVVTLDRIQKEIQRKSQEKEEAEANDKKKSVALSTTDTAQNGGMVENRFTGQNTVNGIRRILFGNQ